MSSTLEPSQESSQKSVNIGYFGGGSWPKKVDDYSGDYAVPHKVSERKSEDQTPLDASNHYQLEPGDRFPDEGFYDDLDILVVSNLVSNHELQFYHAIENMPSDGLIVYEKALSPRFRSHKRMIENGLEDTPEYTPSLHYIKKPAAMAAEALINGYDGSKEDQGLDGIQSVEVVCMEEELDTEREWILSHYEGGMPLDYGTHAEELPVVNIGGRFPQDPDNAEMVPNVTAQGFDMGADVSEEFSAYPQAFSARMALEGDRFSENATLDMLMGKEFDQDQKFFRILGNDSTVGDWQITGFYGDTNNPPSLIFSSENEFEYFDLSDQPSAKKLLVDEYFNVFNGQEPHMSPEEHAEIVRGTDSINTELGMFEDRPDEAIELSEYHGINEVMAPEEVHSFDSDEFWNQVRKVA